MNYPKRVLHVMNSASGGAALSTLGIIQELQSQGKNVQSIVFLLETIKKNNFFQMQYKDESFLDKILCSFINKNEPSDAFDPEKL